MAKRTDPPQQRREEALRRQGRVGQIQGHPDLRARPSPGPEEEGRRRAQERGEEEAVAVQGYCDLTNGR